MDVKVTIFDWTVRFISVGLYLCTLVQPKVTSEDALLSKVDFKQVEVPMS